MNKLKWKCFIINKFHSFSDDVVRSSKAARNQPEGTQPRGGCYAHVLSANDQKAVRQARQRQEGPHQRVRQQRQQPIGIRSRRRRGVSRHQLLRHPAAADFATPAVVPVFIASLKRSRIRSPVTANTRSTTTIAKPASHIGCRIGPNTGHQIALQRHQLPAHSLM